MKNKKQKVVAQTTSSTSNLITEIVGWYGTVVIVGAFFLNSFELIATTSIWYQLLNITGSLGLIWISYVRKVYQPMVLNIIWAAIGALALINILV